MTQGPNMGGKALKTIERSMKDGSWVLLQNCHLSPGKHFSCETATELII